MKTVGPDAGLCKLGTLAGDAFKGGVVLYKGTESLPLGQGLWAMPISGLWGCNVHDACAHLRKG